MDNRMEGINIFERFEPPTTKVMSIMPTFIKSAKLILFSKFFNFDRIDF